VYNGYQFVKKKKSRQAITEFLQFIKLQEFYK